MLRILQLGVGLVGEVTARTAAGEPEVSAVALADIDEKRATETAKKLRVGKVETLTFDVSDRNALFRTRNGVDFVIDGLVLVHRSN